MQQHVEAVQRMQDYIQENLSEEITIEQLAKVANFSSRQAVRLFERYTGYTPSHYIRRLRLKKSALRLRDSDCKIIDVAMEEGFGSVDGYTRAFAREFGKNPKDYAKNPIPLSLFVPYGVKYRKTERSKESMQDVKCVFVSEVERPKRKAIIKRSKSATEYFGYCQEVGCEVWGVLTSIKSICGEPVCMWLPKKYIKENTGEYVQGVEVDENYGGVIPDGFDVIDLPKAKYLMFVSQPFEEEDFESAIEEVMRAWRNYNPAVLGYAWDESNPTIQLEPIGKRGYIELHPVKEIK